MTSPLDACLSALSARDHVCDPTMVDDPPCPDCEAIFASLRALLIAQAAQVEELEKDNAILKLAVPLEEELADRIDEMCKHLLTEQGYTLNSIGQLLVECQRRMASDWTEIGRVRRELVAQAAQLETVRQENEQLKKDLDESLHSGALQAALDAIAGTLDPSTQIADHPNVKFAQMARLRLLKNRPENAVAPSRE